jgi:hypothetical protein
MTYLLPRRAALRLIGAAPFLAPSFLRAEPSAGELRDDIAILRRALALHPGLFRYRTPDDLARRLSALERAYATAPDQEGRFLALSAFLATIRCGHSQCNPYNQRRAVAEALFDRPTRLPFEFAWIDRRMVVLADRSGGRLPPGTLIAAIGGEPAPALLARLLAYARADGHNDAKRVAQMAMRNTDRFETFDIYQGLISPPGSGIFRLRYRLPSGVEAEGDFPALTAAERRAGRHMIETDGTDRPFWSWRIEDGVALLTMPSWVMYNSKWDWRAWLADRFAELKGAKGLVVDLRDNEGGNDCGNAILARLAGRDLAFEAYRQWVRYRRTPPDLDPLLDSWDEDFRVIGEKAKDLGTGFYDLGRSGSDVIAAAGPRLDLPVAALVGPVCSSATFQFAHRARQSGLVRLFGEPTGGNLRGINGGGFFFVRLPGSGLEFDLPIVGYFPVTPQPDSGVIPHERVSPTIPDIEKGADPCLAVARRWVARA